MARAMTASPRYTARRVSSPQPGKKWLSVFCIQAICAQLMSAAANSSTAIPKLT